MLPTPAVSSIVSRDGSGLPEASVLKLTVSAAARVQVINVKTSITALLAAETQSSRYEKPMIASALEVHRLTGFARRGALWVIVSGLGCQQCLNRLA